MAKVVGGPIDPAVAEQIAARGDILSRKKRSIQEIQAFNAKTGWMRLSSAVNVEGTDSIAKANVLSGPTLTDSQTQRSGIDFDGTDNSRAYKKGPLGFRPAPGITSVDISAINRFGTLRNAKVNFICWDVEQLTDLEKLYMRPGFSVLLEWGHSLFLNNSGELEKTVTYVDNFFEHSGSSSKDRLQSDIKSIKIETNYNYDAIYGYVKNFQWSFRKDGGYDCTVDIISIGEVIESIKTTFAPSTSEDITQLEQDDKAKRQARLISPLHDFLGALTEIEPEEFSGIFATEIPSDEVNRAIEIITDNSKTAITFQSLRMLKVRLRSEVGTFSDTYKNLTYITLGNLLEAVNNVFMISEGTTKNYTSYFTGNVKNPSDTYTNSNGTRELLYEKPTYNSFTGHFSLDPMICVIPNLPFTGFPGLISSNTSRATLGNYVDFVGAFPQDYASRKSIYDIWICVENVFEQLKQISQSSNEDDRTVERFISKLLTQISDNLGGVNEFDVTFDEEYSKHIIVDRKLPLEKATLTQIDLTGLRTTLADLSFTSKLSPKLGTIIAISAQAKKGDAGVDAENMFKWNEGLTDRISPAKTLTPVEEVDEDGNKTSAYNKAKESIEKVFKRSTLERGKFDYTQEDFQSLVSSHKLISRQDQSTSAQKSSNKTKPGIIPFELSLTMDGIGGLKIGEAFKISEGILPESYQDKIAFIITGMEHSISSNKWNTTIKAQTITL